MTDIIKWNLADLYDNDGAGMGPFGNKLYQLLLYASY